MTKHDEHLIQDAEDHLGREDVFLDLRKVKK